MNEDRNPQTLQQARDQFGHPLRRTARTAVIHLAPLMLFSVALILVSRIRVAGCQPTWIGPALGGITGGWLLLQAAAFPAARAARRASDRLALLEADAAYGWRPRENAPHPARRADTHDRYWVQTESAEGGTLVGLVSWYHLPHQGWQREDGWAHEPVCCHDAEQIASARAQMTEIADRLEQAERQAQATHTAHPALAAPAQIRLA